MIFAEFDHYSTSMWFRFSKDERLFTFLMRIVGFWFLILFLRYGFELSCSDCLFSRCLYFHSAQDSFLSVAPLRLYM